MTIDQLLIELEQLRKSDLPSNIKASRSYSIKCKLRKLGWAEDTTPSDTTTWQCPKCENKVVAHVPMVEVLCNRHTGGQIRMKH